MRVGVKVVCVAAIQTQLMPKKKKINLYIGVKIAKRDEKGSLGIVSRITSKQNSGGIISTIRF